MSTKPHNKTQSTPTKGLVYPIKKTYDYYKTSENLWNSKYLTCDKLAQYYHNPHSEYLSGPNSPIKLSLEESIKKHKILSEKTSIQVKQSKQRLHQRKTEREQVKNN